MHVQYMQVPVISNFWVDPVFASKKMILNLGTKRSRTCLDLYLQSSSLKAFFIIVFANSNVFFQATTKLANTFAKTNKFLFSVQERFCLQKQVIAERRYAEKSQEICIRNNLSSQEFVPEYVVARFVASLLKCHPKCHQKNSTVTLLWIVIHKMTLWF